MRPDTSSRFTSGAHRVVGLHPEVPTEGKAAGMAQGQGGRGAVAGHDQGLGVQSQLERVTPGCGQDVVLAEGRPVEELPPGAHRAGGAIGDQHVERRQAEGAPRRQPPHLLLEHAGLDDVRPVPDGPADHAVLALTGPPALAPQRPRVRHIEGAHAAAARRLVVGEGSVRRREAPPVGQGAPAPQADELPALQAQGLAAAVGHGVGDLHQGAGAEGDAALDHHARPQGGRGAQVQTDGSRTLLDPGLGPLLEEVLPGKGGAEEGRVEVEAVGALAAEAVVDVAVAVAPRG
ncbi:MAG: hypothetical protein ABIL09_16255, partial [Gemmatimonadota bacterium]